MRLVASEGFAHWVRASKGTCIEDIEAYVERCLRTPALVVVDDDTGPPEHAVHRCVDLVQGYVDLAWFAMGGDMPLRAHHVVQTQLMRAIESPDAIELGTIIEALKRERGNERDSEEQCMGHPDDR